MKLPCLHRGQFPLESKGQKGYIALIAVIVVSALVVLVASSTSLLGISESDMGLKERQSEEAFYLATACAEEALIKLKEDLKYRGGETFNFDNGYCTVVRVRGGGNQNRLVEALGSAYGMIKRIRIEVDFVNPVLEVGSWQQVADF